METDWLRTQTAAFAEAVAGLDPDKRVPTCPEWSVRVLVGHIGQSSRWVADVLRTGQADGLPDPADADPPPDWTDWLRAGAEELIGAVEKAGDAPVWTFVGPRPAPFWVRRITHDTAVHYVDASITAGRGYEIAPSIAADVVSGGMELLSEPALAQFKPELSELRGDGQTLLFRSTDGHGTWSLTRTPEGLRSGRTETTADVTVTGTAQDIALLVYRRISPNDLRVSGDEEVLRHLLARLRI